MKLKKMMPKMKPLSMLKSKAKGSVHHVELHPAQHSDGSQAFTTMVHRNRLPAAQSAMDAGGPYTPTPEPEETQHPDYPDAMNHIAKAFGVPKPSMENDDEEDGSDGE
jgi:hypothetical protein